MCVFLRVTECPCTVNGLFFFDVTKPTIPAGGIIRNSPTTGFQGAQKSAGVDLCWLGVQKDDALWVQVFSSSPLSLATQTQQRFQHCCSSLLFTSVDVVPKCYKTMYFQSGLSKNYCIVTKGQCNPTGVLVYTSVLKRRGYCAAAVKQYPDMHLPLNVATCGTDIHQKKCYWSLSLKFLQLCFVLFKLGRRVICCDVCKNCWRSTFISANSCKI